MTTTQVIILVAVFAVLVLVYLALGPVMKRRRGDLRGRFGPEYDRAVDRHNGDEKAARAELSERLKRHGDLRTRTLPAEERERYRAQWGQVQQRFVDDPTGAVAEADHLLTRLAHDRGYPADSHDDRIAALSVHHPHQIDGYRRIHALAGRTTPGDTATEDLRTAMLGAGEIFEKLMDSPHAGDREDRDRAEGRGGGIAERLHLPGAGREDRTDGTDDRVDGNRPAHRADPRADGVPAEDRNGVRR
ncbi:hypothetical protein GCM10027160_11110 [Streptomyces calidiresistens]|uniref:Secreted protein n=1 Tax=Streptomyces calidiresistens TaxID=1485586 RepID=A0A7W3T7K8_9ACTN|nr:hypothetical protein [Streptomyces calidiresistens]MBB0232425.1 hypothetical protein [Streptomyces calidiresistens]